MSHACLQCFLFNLAFGFASRLALTMKISLVVHPDGLHPVTQVKAHHLVKEEDMSYETGPRPQGPSCEVQVETGRSVQKVGNANLGQHGSKQGLHARKGNVARLRWKRDVQSKKLETRISNNMAPERNSTPTRAKLPGQGGNGVSSPKSWKREFGDSMVTNKGSSLTGAKLRGQCENVTCGPKSWTREFGIIRPR